MTQDLRRRDLLKLALVVPVFGQPQLATAPRQVSGVYPHLAMFNGGDECGTGCVVPWAGRLWVATYSPHAPGGSDDKLYAIDEQLTQTVRPESIGGTPANRMIHLESQQLFIGPYVIDRHGTVRVIPYARMFGRPTGNARHLRTPERTVYCASMEEGLYEVDVASLEVTQLYEDGNAMLRRKATTDIAGPLLPGYHGKGLYSGQGRLVYANNGEYRGERLPPSAPSGCLAEWDGASWTVVRRNQFCEVTGPGGLTGNPHPATDPIWSIGWDHRSLLLMLRDRGRWHSYRLPKASHTYDGAHGWNTEWPRIRDIGERDLLMTMHGMFWRFPKAFTHASSSGIAPRSTYLKVIGDVARWGDRVVLGCDDTARSEFTNRRRAKGTIAGPGQSQSNLWFVTAERLDALGVPFGRGGVWIDDDLRADEVSDPFLFAGFERRGAHLTHAAATAVSFVFEVDRAGADRWERLRAVAVPPGGCTWTSFDATEAGAWVRVRAAQDAPGTTVYFHYADRDRRTERADARFDALARPSDREVNGGLLWARDEDRRTLLFAARRAVDGGVEAPTLYELSADLRLRRAVNADRLGWMETHLAVPRGVLAVDAASVIYTDDGGRRWRLPKGDASFDTPGLLVEARVSREVSTERDLFNAHGTFYELPAENAGGIAVIRPIATHNRRVHDYCSYRGLMVMSGLASSAADAEHVIRSEDGRVALWVGVSDDLWAFGKVRGRGGPMHDSNAAAGVPSDPYLMTGYDRKRLTLSHAAAGPVRMVVEVDVTGAGHFRTYLAFDVAAGQVVQHAFPDGFGAYWVRVTTSADCIATATLVYD